MKIRLIGLKSTSWELAPGNYILGRAPTPTSDEKALDLTQFDDGLKVSGRHALLKVFPDGALTIEELGSTNGTYVLRIGSAREELLKAGVSVPVSPGDKILVGSILLTIE